MKSTRSADYVYKQQAHRLQEFLKVTGINLKHTHALEAVAQMHGAKNWHALSHQASRTDDNSNLWLISTYGKGSLQLSTIASSLELAINFFIRNAYVYSCLFPYSDLKVAAEKDDGALQGLYLFVDNILYLSMSLPGQEELQEYSQVARFRDPQDFLSIASELQDALELRKLGNVEERQQQFSQSLIAYQLEQNIDEMLLNGPPENRGTIPATSAQRTQELWDTMAHIKTWVTTTGKVLGS